MRFVKKIKRKCDLKTMFKYEVSGKTCLKLASDTSITENAIRRIFFDVILCVEKWLDLTSKNIMSNSFMSKQIVLNKIGRCGCG